MDDTIKYWCLCLAKLLLALVDYLADLAFGVTLAGGSKQERRDAEKYEKSAQVVKILWKAKHHVSVCSRLRHFIYKHEEYVHPEVVLRHKNMTLMSVEKEYALFAVSDPRVDVYDPTKFPFVAFDQYRQAEKMIVVPIKSFHRLADELGDPKVPVAMMGMTARCGSTLLIQMFNRVPGIRVLSEPIATISIHELRMSGKVTVEESKRLLKSAIRLQCKIEPGSGVERIFFKLMLKHAHQMTDTGELFPQMKFFFNTRHPVPTLKSGLIGGHGRIHKTLYVRLGIVWFEQLALGFNISYNPKYDHATKDIGGLIPKIKPEEFGVLSYSMSVLSYFENKSMFGRAILYENLSKDPKGELEHMFDKVGLSREHIPAALEAMKKDSKSGADFVRGKDIELNPELLDTFDGYMRKLDLPIRHAMSEQEFQAVFGV